MSALPGGRVAPGGEAAAPALGETPRRFPPPWSVDELEECFVIKDFHRSSAHTSTSRITTAAVQS